VVDFKETVKEIFEVCTNFPEWDVKAEDRVKKKIEDILKQIYGEGKSDGYQSGIMMFGWR